MGLGNDVIYCGSVNNVWEYMQCMDVFVLPSLFEGLPIVGVEAQAAGLPFITSKNVTQELKMTDAVEYVSLDEPIDRWVNAILQYQNYQRKENCSILSQEGYDINMTSEEVRDMYLL